MARADDCSCCATLSPSLAEGGRGRGSGNRGGDRGGEGSIPITHLGGGMAPSPVTSLCAVLPPPLTKLA
eukprot:CAMPEP_0173238800 /NCGR_PEP_ID=MMETSP1142-20121109/12845_1 /TAXON_ID=483371 /ORGANISM="non described non described, Strain CCMP2298" /LENGTH=68 /DNA_ID=CAMNT_0014169717 /DNA_START=63 /DNA_END=269 /DNA_ORIENTATION=+